MKNTSYRYWMIYVIAIVAAMGGLLFGFDTGVISGAIPFFQKDFGIDDSMVEVVTSSGLLGAILGALCCGKLTDRIGRRKVILTSAVIFAFGALGSGWAPDIYHLIAARLFLGVAIGISSFAVPLYIAEVSPAKSRGMFVAMFQLMITIGLLVSYLSDLYFADETSVSCWRPMFYVGVIPAIILFVGMLLVPPSPRWLMSVGREEESLSVLKMVEHPDLVNASFEQMRNEMRKNDERQGCFKDLAQPWLRNALVIAIGIMFFQQFVGINTVIYYSPKIFLMAGFDGAVSAIGASVGVGVVNLLFTLLSVYFVDRLGRRKLYFLGLSGIVISLLLLATSFIFAAQLGDSGKWLSIVLIFLICGIFRYQHRAVRLVDCVGSVSTKAKRVGDFSRLVVRMVFQCDRIVYFLQDIEGVFNIGNRINDQWRKPRESGGSVLILCVHWNCGDYLGIFLCTGNERSFIGEDRGFLEKRRTPER